MKKITKMILLVFVLLFAFTACSKETGSKTVDKTKTDKKQEEEKKTETKEEKEDVGDKEQSQPSDTQEPSDGNADSSLVKITVYFSNDDATAFVTGDVEEASLSPEAVMQALITKGAVAADVKVMNFKTVEVDGKSSIELDLNSEFAAYVKNLGTTGEYYAIGSVCNTYLNAYDCQQIKITVDGQDLTTGHAEYPGYMTAFE